MFEILISKETLMEILIQILVGISISCFGICYLFGFFDELLREYISFNLEFFDTCIEDTQEIRLFARYLALTMLYFLQLGYYSGVYTIKILRTSFRFLVMKSK